MTVRIWSDVRCPYCYIGKRKFERALADFAHSQSVDLIWHSFELDPALVTQPDLHTYDYLGRIKGMDREQVTDMHEHVQEIGKDVDINFDFERLVVANSFNAHRLIQLAKAKGMANEVEEELFKAHFSDGKNIDDHDTLVAIATSAGLAPEDIKEVLTTDRYANEVRQDETMARSIGIRGVPFFIVNDRLAVSGAQSPELFLRTLEKAWEESETSPPQFVNVDPCWLQNHRG